jgi:DUF438 domain-containing protein
VMENLNKEQIAGTLEVGQDITEIKKLRERRDCWNIDAGNQR